MTIVHVGMRGIVDMPHSERSVSALTLQGYLSLSELVDGLY